jgi:hypothetical protein
MRRVLLVVSLAAVAALAGQSAFAAGHRAAASRGRAILCPLTTLPCCGPPIASRDQVPCCGVDGMCCPPNAMCVAPSLTIAATPDPSVEGRSVVVSGRLTGGSGVAVQLWEEVAGARGFGVVGSGVTDASGNYSITRAGVTTNRSWYATASGDTSTTISQQVAAVVTGSVARLPLQPGARRFVLSGSVSPDHAGESVMVQVRRGGRWRALGTAPLTAGSRYGFPFHAARRETVRAYWPGDSHNAAAASAAVVTGSV